MSNVSNAVVGPLAKLVREGLISITEFVDNLKQNGLIVVEVALSDAPILDYMSRPIPTRQYIVAHVIHEDNPLGVPVAYALQTPQPLY